MTSASHTLGQVSPQIIQLQSWRHGAALVLILVLMMRVWRSYWRLKAMPPGPRGLPIIGNLLQMPMKTQWFKFTEWGKEYGPIMSLNIAGQPIIVLNTFKAAADLLDRRSAIYSDRPRLIMADEVFCGGVFMVLSRYGERWRRMRRAAHESFNTRSAEKYRPVQAREAALAVLNILKTPDNWDTHIKLATGSAILGAVYNWPTLTSSEKDTSLLKRVHSFGVTLSKAAVPGAFLIDTLNFLDHLPTWMIRSKKEGYDWHERETELFQKFINDAKDKMSEKTGPCLSNDLIEQKERYNISNKEAAWVAGTMFAAGAETTSATLLYFIQAAIMYPEVMEKARKELDEVVGRTRVPSFDDIPELPYLQALTKELLRWRPVVPQGVPHAATEDDWYEGYLIPKGSILFGNVWSMHRDPEIYPDFDEFRPERFLEGNIAEDTHGMGHAGFGFGRRVCVGQNFAMQSLHINIATLLWALNFERVIGPDGKEILPSKIDFIDTGLTVLPISFPCKISLRFPEAKSILQETFVDQVET